MDKYRKAFLATAMIFSIFGGVFLILSLVSLNTGGIPLVIACMAWWLMYFYLTRSSKIAFWLSFAMVNIYWWFLLIGFIQKVSYEIRNRAGYDIFSILARYLLFEIFVLLPLTIVLVFGLLVAIGLIRARRTE